MIVKDIVCSSIMMQSQGRTRFARWHLENEYLTRGSVTLRFAGQYTQGIEEVRGFSLGVPLIETRPLQNKKDMVCFFLLGIVI